MSDINEQRNKLESIKCWQCDEVVDLLPREELFVARCKCGTIDVTINPLHLDPKDYLTTEICSQCHDVVEIHRVHITDRDVRIYYGCRCGNYKGLRYKNPC